MTRRAAVTSEEKSTCQGIDQVDQEIATVGLCLQSAKDSSAQFKVHGNSGGLDGNTTHLFISTGIGETRTALIRNKIIPALLTRESVGNGFTVIDVSNDGHVTNIGRDVHEGTDLINSEVNLTSRRKEY